MFRFIQGIRGIFLIVALMAFGVAHAEEWPTRSVTIIVPFAAGGTTDIVGRIIAQSLSERIG